MTEIFPPAPAVGRCLLPTRPSRDARALLALRRSAGKNTLGAPGPSEDVILQLLRVASRVPDHRRLEPWRFITFAGEDRARFGQKIMEIYAADTPDADPRDLDLEASRFTRAPVVIAVISSPDTAHKTPVWEQELSVGAVCQNLLLAANAAGWAGVWLTEWLAFHEGIDQALGLGDTERVAGFIYLGTATANPPERPRARIDGKTIRYSDLISN
jgi:nitroreductase